ncbi:MAG: hypothetical protein J6I73_02010 [Treponema sp.]|nr:hypothetical protein [Treponema sp.]
MKFTAQFTSRNGKLFFKDSEIAVPLECIVFIDACEIPLDAAALEQFARSFDDAFIVAVRVPRSSVDIGETRYDEAFLAVLRTFLKNREARNSFCNTYEIIVPECDNSAVYSEEAAMRFIAAMCHTARRIKDCASVIGFAIPEAFSTSQATAFIEEMRIKHSHYIFFSKTSRADAVLY